MENRIAIDTLEDIIEKIYNKKSMARTIYMHFLKCSNSWNDNKQKISNKYWRYQEKLEEKIEALREAVYALNEAIYLNEKRKEIEEEKKYMEWLSDVEAELPF